MSSPAPSIMQWVINSNWGFEKSHRMNNAMMNPEDHENINVLSSYFRLHHPCLSCNLLNSNSWTNPAVCRIISHRFCKCFRFFSWRMEHFSLIHVKFAFLNQHDCTLYLSLVVRDTVEQQILNPTTAASHLNNLPLRFVTAVLLTHFS